MVETLYYFIKFGKGTLDEIEVEGTTTIGKLREKIYGDQKGIFHRHNLAKGDLELYAPSGLELDSEESLLERADIQDLPRLRIWQTVKEVVNNGLGQKLVHIIIVPRTGEPTLGGSGTLGADSRKRPRPSTPDDVETRHKKVLQFAHDAAAPLDTTDSSMMSSKQEKNPIYNGRPINRRGPPLAIYHEAFARLKDDLDHPDTIQVTAAELRMTHVLFSSSAEFYEGDGDRIMNTIGIWESLLGHMIRIILLDKNTTFGATVNPKVGVSALLCCIEWKGEFGSTGDAGYKASSSFCEFAAQSMNSKIHSSTCSPCLLIGVMGPYFCIMGAVFVDEVIVEPFTDWIFLGGDPHTRIGPVARIFKAAADALRRLEQYYRSVNFSNKVNRQAYLPSPTVSDGSMQPPPLRYTGRLFPDKVARPLFFAKMDNRDVVVKFPKQYCKEAHQLLAREGLAPELFFCGPIRGGLFMVVMDYIEDVTESDSDPATLPSSAYLDIERAVRLLHDNDLVFGDLRRPNIIVVKKNTQGDMRLGAHLIDFDWCGKDSEAKYPDTLDDSGVIEWAAGVRRCGVMKKEHDLFHLRTFECL